MSVFFTAFKTIFWELFKSLRREDSAPKRRKEMEEIKNRDKKRWWEEYSKRHQVDFIFLTTAVSPGSSALSVTSHSSSTNESYSCKTQIHAQVRNHYPKLWLKLPLHHYLATTLVSSNWPVACFCHHFLEKEKTNPVPANKTWSRAGRTSGERDQKKLQIRKKERKTKQYKDFIIS